LLLHEAEDDLKMGEVFRVECRQASSASDKRPGRPVNGRAESMRAGAPSTWRRDCSSTLIGSCQQWMNNG